MSTYPFQEIESRWQRYWEENNTFETPREPDESKPKFYVLDMFPYPSGVGLHVGHPLGYIATDILGRYKKMQGFNVLHPMGFDAFGLPAEQFAVEHGVHPRITTENNIENMVRQLKRLGLGYDWDRRLATTDVDYYKWTQWIFLQLYNAWVDTDTGKARPIAALEQAFDRGQRETPDGKAWNTYTRLQKQEVLSQYRLAFLAEVPVNWCPALGTVLANEEVTNEGRSERGNYPVYRRPLKQWMFRITAMADRLLDDLSLVDWPEPIKIMQRNWIGKSKGAEVAFNLAGEAAERVRADGQTPSLRVYTTRPDTLFGATYMVVAPEHPMVAALTTDEQQSHVQAYCAEAAARTERDRMADAKQKTGVFSGSFAINPLSGDHIPIWIADYVLMGYGTGAIMAVPAHDERDFAFAKTFDLPIKAVVAPGDTWLTEQGVSREAYLADARISTEAFVGNGMAVNSAADLLTLDGMDTKAAKATTIAFLEQAGLGEGQTQYKLRDWLFSRQRYWGEPFPILHGPDGEIRPVDEQDLPVALPPMEDFRPEASDDPDAPPRPPLAKADAAWRTVEIDGVTYERELNTMPQWAGSCWYYLRFIDNRNDAAMVSPSKERYWMGERGIDLYVGGAEHAVLHLLYSRFWHKCLYDLGHVGTPEPFGRLFNQGYIQAYAYRDERGVAVEATEVVDQDGQPAMDVQDQPGRQFFFQGQPVTQEYGKMGKSLKNAVNPDDICDQYGCDTLRLYEMYMGPLEASKPWSTRDIVGVNRFLRRVWRTLVDEATGTARVSDTKPSEDLLRTLNKTIEKVTGDMERLSFNTAIAALIELLAKMTKQETTSRMVAEPFVLMLAPLAPHMAEELWRRLGHQQSLADAAWPKADAAMLVDEKVFIAVQINGKVRSTLEISTTASKESVLSAAKADEKVARYLEGQTLRREIYVPGKIVNLVVG